MMDDASDRRIALNSAKLPELLPRVYASVAIVGALLDRLIINKVISRSDAAAILDDAITTLKGLGNLASVPGAVRVVGDVSAHLAKHDMR
jgi:hypothetical protein